MDELINQSPALTQKAAFERVFGCRYVKSTVCRHRGVWKRSNKGLREQFERMGTDEGALWGEFVKKTDYRRDVQRQGFKLQEVEVEDQQMDYGMDSTMEAINLSLVDSMNGGLSDDQSSLGALGQG